eukprot:TRINITY_DN3907_c0_g1_i1.p4 TRINITY_DN3907_c0_g1~~TRINITY_DN3907_c0_g1_i1.p4  ORF type:complete len:329 (+),score=29.57 TRINITY_DN3907_c0_g1_i1:5502-6488(+)
MESEAIELENTRKLLEESENARTDLRCSLSESAEKVKKESEKAKKAQLMLIEENKELTINNLALSNKAYEIEQENAALKDQVAVFTISNKKMAAEICLLKEEQKDSAGMQKVLEEVQKQKDLLEASYKTVFIYFIVNRVWTNTRRKQWSTIWIQKSSQTKTQITQSTTLKLESTIRKSQPTPRHNNKSPVRLKSSNRREGQAKSPQQENDSNPSKHTSAEQESIDILKGTVKECDMYKTLTKEKSEIITRLQNELYVINSELDSYKEASKKQFNELLAKHDLKAKELQEKLAQKRELDISYKCIFLSLSPNISIKDRLHGIAEQNDIL